MKYTQILLCISFFLLINNAIPSLLDFIGVDSSQYYMPFQIFALCYLLLYIVLPKKVTNPFE